MALIISGAATLSTNGNEFPTIYSGTLLGVPVPILLLIVAFALGSLILNYTRFGRNVLAIGGNEEATSRTREKL